jgi:hypothetical protein
MPVPFFWQMSNSRLAADADSTWEPAYVTALATTQVISSKHQTPPTTG